MPVSIRGRDEFARKKDDGTIDESATDMAWITHVVRRMTKAGWDEIAIAFTVFMLLGKKSPELQKRKKTPEHAWDYLFRTIWKAGELVRKTPLENKDKKDNDNGDIDVLLDSF
jgi:hypothetical protein